MSYIKVKAINLVHALSGTKPTIVRTNKRTYTRL